MTNEELLVTQVRDQIGRELHQTTSTKTTANRNKVGRPTT